jgi:hypothetical protein
VGAVPWHSLQPLLTMVKSEDQKMSAVGVISLGPTVPE